MAKIEPSCKTCKRRASSRTALPCGRCKYNDTFDDNYEMDPVLKDYIQEQEGESDGKR